MNEIIQIVILILLVYIAYRVSNSWTKRPAPSSRENDMPKEIAELIMAGETRQATFKYIEALRINLAQANTRITATASELRHSNESKV